MLLTFLLLLPFLAREAASKHASVPRPALVWDTKLAADAEKWAQHLAHDNQGLKHSTGDQRPGQGENLYWISSGGSLAGGSQYVSSSLSPVHWLP